MDNYSIERGQDTRVVRGALDESRRFSLADVSLQENMPSDYLKFNAYSMRDLLLRKLSANPSFSSQVYPGSNLSILVDLVSYMYQTLVYQVNHAASESMFSDTQYFENIVRLAKMLGYSAKGIVPSAAMFRVDDADKYQHWRILPFSRITSGGKTYSYSPLTPGMSAEIPSNLSEGSSYDVLLLNGRWRLYMNAPLTASGQKNETFRLSIGSDLNNKRLVSGRNMFAAEVVRARKSGNDDETDWTNTVVKWFVPTQFGLFMKRTRVLDSAYDSSEKLYSGGRNGRVFNVELDAEKNLVLTFGDGIGTESLVEGAELYIFYLETEGTNGTVTASEETSSFVHSPSDLGLGNDEDLYLVLFGLGTVNSDGNVDFTAEDTTSSKNATGKITARCASTSSRCYAEEDVEDIRANAPQWFKLNGRLVTKGDYDFYMRNSPDFKSVLADVLVMNNWEYASTFYRWLAQLGDENHGNPRYYLNSARLVKYGNAAVADAADNNNVYVWYIPAIEYDSLNFDQVVGRFKAQLAEVKDLSHEPVFMPGIRVTCEISSVPVDLAKRTLAASNGRTTKANFSNGKPNTWLEVRLASEYSLTSARDVNARISAAIVQHFKSSAGNIGFGPFSTDGLVDEIMSAVPGVSEIYTASRPTMDGQVVYTPGICLACWIDDGVLVDLGDAFWRGTQILLEKFQYPVFWTNNVSDIGDGIVIVGRNSAGIGF